MVRFTPPYIDQRPVVLLRGGLGKKIEKDKTQVFCNDNFKGLVLDRVRRTQFDVRLL